MSFRLERSYLYSAAMKENNSSVVVHECVRVSVFPFTLSRMIGIAVSKEFCLGLMTDLAKPASFAKPKRPRERFLEKLHNRSFEFCPSLFRFTAQKIGGEN